MSQPGQKVKPEVNQLVFVYGTLLSGFGNHRACIEPFVKLGEAEFVEPFQTEPAYTMVSLGGFPGVIANNGGTAIKGEIYRLKSNAAVRRLNALEGHYGKDDPSNFYNVTELETPHGEALMYTLPERYLERCPVVESGNWRTK